MSADKPWMAPEYREKKRKYDAKRRASDPEARRTSYRDWAARNPDKVFAKTIRLRYNITIEQYNKMLESQGGKCALFETCGATVSGRYHKRWHVDHDHETGKVRGLLCHDCNSHRVGTNTLESARAVVRYLEQGASLDCTP